jgi:hypothetical protein
LAPNLNPVTAVNGWVCDTGILAEGPSAGVLAGDETGLIVGVVILLFKPARSR